MLLTSFEQRILVFIFAFILGGTLASVAVARGATPRSGAQVALSATEGCQTYSKNLALGATHSDVKTLQKFLNAQGFEVADSGAGAPGNETAYFGEKTRAALKKFQAAQRIAPVSGYFGPLSRAKVNALCSNPGASKPAEGAVPPIAIGTTLPPPATPAPLATSSLGIATSTSGINPRSVVGVLCFYRTPTRMTAVKGTGVIVNPEGYVLTAKHGVDPRWTREAYDDTLTPEQKTFYETATLDHCEVGLPEDSTPLPTAEEIKRGSATRLITRRFQYLADVYFVPDRTGLSDIEFDTADFAILKIKDTVPNCGDRNTLCFEFDHFPYSPAATVLPKEDADPIVSWGYPGEGRIGDAFYDFYLTGTVGTVDYYLIGDTRFESDRFNFSFKASDITTGRSGSPLFSGDKIIGLLYGSVSEAESYNLTINAIRGILQDHALGWILQ